MASGEAATVAGKPIDVETVRSIAAAQGLALAPARALAIEDALLADEARALSPASTTASAERAVHARALLESLVRAAREAGPPTDEELAPLRERHWVTVDRPAAAKTRHAVVLVKPATDRDAARALADRLHEAATGATTPADFEKRVKAVETGGLDVKVEDLPPVVADGRMFQLDHGEPASPAGSLVAAYAAAATRLREPGELSPPVETEFGYHVIWLEGLIPARVLTPSELREHLTPEVIEERAKRAYAELLDAARAANPVAVAPTHAALLRQLPAVE